MRPSAANCRSRRCSNSRCAACWPIRAPSRALVDDFAAQWLNLRRVDEVVVHPDFYPDFDDNLLDGFRRETELFIASTLREDRSVSDLLRADYTFVNERLARHYRIPGIYGPRFRRVTLPNPDQRGGLLAQGAILATTSYPDRTSPVLRGKWLLDNIFGVYVPPPPPDVNTTLTEVRPGTLPPTIRERLAQHRTNPMCGSCHAVIDPPGFALENFDAIGGWRTIDESGKPVDAVGTTVSGASIDGLTGLRALLLRQPDQFPTTLTEKLLAYALGRRLEYYDRPAVRQIVRAAAADDYRWSSLILGIVKKSAFPDAGILMTFLTAKPLPRRTVLRGLGAAMSLPLLDAMTPAVARAAAPVHRFQTFYVPNGMAMEYWLPKTAGADFELTPILEPLAAFRNQMLVLSGLKANWNYIHAGASGSFLTGTTRGGRNEVEIIADVSMDQLLARHFASETQVASLELAMDPANNAGACTGNLSCVYTHTLSWRSKTQPLPMEFNPRAVFEKLFGDSGSTDRAAREARLRQHKSILDSVNDKLASLKSRSGPRTRPRSTSTPSRSATSSAASRRPKSSAISICRRWINRKASRRSSRITWI